MKAKESNFKTRNYLITAIVLAAVCAIGVVLRWNKGHELKAQIREQTIPTVAVVTPKPGQPANSMAMPAEIRPQMEAPIYARANGYLKRRLVDIGDHVKSGQLLAEIDTPELDQELERARAQLAQAEATLGIAKITAARWTDLLKTASVSEQEAAEKQADFKLKTALAESARAEVRRLEKLKSFASITAPFNGTVTARNVDVGDLIAAGGNKLLFHLMQTKTLRVFVQVPQAMARSIVAGQLADMTLPEFPKRVFSAKVVRTAGAISSDSRTLLVELEVDNSTEEILAGGYAQVRFIDAKMGSPLTLPANTVMFRADGPHVGVVLSDDKVDLRVIKLGRDFGQTVEIVDGVNEEDRIIVNPPESLTSGMPVVSIKPTIMEKSK